MHQHEELPSGKSVIRTFDAEGRIVQEMHSYGALEIAIQLNFDAGVKTGEMYFVKKRLVSLKSYDKGRVQYPDMPAPDAVLEDIGAQLVKAAAAERRQSAKAAKEHVPNPELAAKIDAFCRSMLETGTRADAENWIGSDKHTLGELSPAKGRSLVDKLMRAGAKRLYACKIDQYENSEENTGHLVIELPEAPGDRKKVLAEVDRLASRQGFRGEPDHGQQYAYVKLD